MPKLELTDELQHVILAQIQDAEDFSLNELSNQRQKTWRYYNGQIDIKAPRDRSAVVRPEVRNAVEMMMPQLMGVFASYPTAVEFFSKSDPLLAEEATERVNNIFWEDNDGWVVLHDAVKDSLVTRTAGFKIHMMDREYIDGTDALAMTEQVETREDDTFDGLFGDQPPVDRWKPDPGVKFHVEVIPSEELLIDRYAKDAETASIIGQKSRPRLGDLVQMGFDKEKLKGFGTGPRDDTIEQGEQARTGYSLPSDSEPSQWQLRKVEFTETFHRIDIDDDGELERVQICCIGNEILQAEEVQEQPYILFSSIRIPHTAVGRCPGELLIDNQEFESVLMRQTLDNLFWSNNPAIGVLRNAVNPFQVDNWGFGSVIDQRVPNAVQIYQIPFFADKILPMFEFFSQQKESLVGISKATAGLDPNAFRNQTAAATMGTLNAAQRQIEMLARVIAQTGLVPLFKKLFKLIYRKPWPYGMKINVGLGSGTMMEKFMILGQLKQAQEGILTMLGPENPLCDMMQYSFTLNETAKLAPYYPANAFFNPPSVVAQKLQQKQQNPDPPKPDPKMIEAQAKAQKTQQDMAIEQQKAQIDAQLAQQKAALDMAAAQQKMQLEGMKVTSSLKTDNAKAISHSVTAEKKLAGELNIKQQEMEAEARLSQQELIVESQLEAMKIKADARAGQGVLPKKRIKAPEA